MEQAQEALSAFAARFSDAYNSGLRSKLGLLSEREGDLALTQDLLDRMVAGKADFTLTFRRLSEAAMGPEGDVAVRSLFEDPAHMTNGPSAGANGSVKSRRKVQRAGLPCSASIRPLSRATTALRRSSRPPWRNRSSDRSRTF